MIFTTTPAQTVGPYFQIGMPWDDGPFSVPRGSEGEITISGTVFDGAAAPIPDALIETWQADSEGHFNDLLGYGGSPEGDGLRGRGGTLEGDGLRGYGGSPEGDRLPGHGGSPSGDGFRGFARATTDDDGRFWIVTVKPGPVPWPADGMQAPHIGVSVFARGMLHRCVTRIYFADEAQANLSDPLLARVPADRRATLLAEPTDDGYRFDIRLQGPDETVFFDV